MMKTFDEKIGFLFRNLPESISTRAIIEYSYMTKDDMAGEWSLHEACHGERVVGSLSDWLRVEARLQEGCQEVVRLVSNNIAVSLIDRNEKIREIAKWVSGDDQF